MTVAQEKKFCVILPAYREEKRIGRVVREVLKYCKHVIVVDDGSPDGTGPAAEAAGAKVLKHDANRGKGVALETGFRFARKNDFEFVITMDSDGQHAPDEIPLFVAEYERSGTPVIIGNRMGHPDSMPPLRKATNYFMSWLLSREMHQAVPDTQSGYRLYKCDILPMVTSKSAGFAAESEVLLNLSRAGIRIGSVPIKVIYRDEKSKIDPVKDSVRFFNMLKRYRESNREDADK